MNCFTQCVSRRFTAILFVAASIMAPFVSSNIAQAAESAVVIPPPDMETPAHVQSRDQGAGLETAVLAGGCFWGVQAVFQHVKGVTNAVSGYSGGAQKDADYRAVSSGRTTHAESVKVTFDPQQISYGQILQIYFSVAHDPTQLNRQGPDIGPQYRSEIFPENEAQRKIARDYIAQLDKARVFKRIIATKVADGPASFFAAEEYHQDYAVKHPYQPYIVFNDAPKVENLKRLFPELWRDKPVTVAEAMRTN